MWRLMSLLSLLWLMILPASCLKTEVLNAPIEQVDTVMYRKPHKPLPPKEEEDTARVPIEFDPSVEEWNKTNVDL